MTFEDGILINAPAKQIFQIYSDIENWHEWDKEILASKINGRFEAGSIVVLTPAHGPRAKIEIVEVIPNQSFLVASKLPFCRILFDHSLTIQGKSTQVVHRVEFTGILSFLFEKLIGKKIRKSLPETLQGLKNEAERHKSCDSHTSFQSP